MICDRNENSSRLIKEYDTKIYLRLTPSNKDLRRIKGIYVLEKLLVFPEIEGAWDSLGKRF